MKEPLSSDFPSALRGAVSAAQWFQGPRRAMREFFEKNLYGALPRRPEKVSFELIEGSGTALAGNAIRRQFRIVLENGGRRHEMLALMYLPKNLSAPCPAIAGLNFKGNAGCATEPEVLPVEEPHGEQANRWDYAQIIQHGYAIATMARNDLFFDDPSRRGDSIWHLYDENCAEDRTKTSISAWAFGYSLLYELLAAQPECDPHRIIAHGHSRLGKTALWAVANDQRFAGVVSNDSGCAGASLFRGKEGEQLDQIFNRFPHWFVPRFGEFIGIPYEKLPFDQHWLLSLALPRPVLVASASEDAWADPENEFRSATRISDVCRLFGAEGIGEDAVRPEIEQPCFGDLVGYYCRRGKHDVTSVDWKFVLDFFSARL